MAGNTEKREAYLKKMEEERERREKAEISCVNMLESMEAIMHDIGMQIDTNEDAERRAELAVVAAKVATAAAQLRMSIGYAIGMGCYSGTFADTEEGNG